MLKKICFYNFIKNKKSLKKIQQNINLNIIN